MCGVEPGIRATGRDLVVESECVEHVLIAQVEHPDAPGEGHEVMARMVAGDERPAVAVALTGDAFVTSSGVANPILEYRVVVDYCDPGTDGLDWVPPVRSAARTSAPPVESAAA